MNVADGVREVVAGRVCPASYSYSPSSFARPPEVQADVLYVIGGLYGNRFALAEIERMAKCEEERAQLVFNGDFHWFDAEPESFRRIDDAVARHTALRGNVETELAGDDDANGCGCAYPESVPDDDVERSNAILDQLRAAARRVDADQTRHAGAAGRLADASRCAGRRHSCRYRAWRCMGVGGLALCA